MGQEFNEANGGADYPGVRATLVRHGSMGALMDHWGDRESVSSYLDRCRVDTPAKVVAATWERVNLFRPEGVGKVVDLGAGDGRFALEGCYRSYVGYEIDRERSAGAVLPAKARLLTRCAFADDKSDADVCIGNPPFVRNQQMPASWLREVRELVRLRTGVVPSGLANAWQYFFLNALARVKSDGLAALVVPFEWVSRPSSAALRDYIGQERWDVHVYRLPDGEFPRVLTTASISIVDKRGTKGQWRFFEVLADGKSRRLESATGHRTEVLEYVRAADIGAFRARARRGLSPGTQKVLVLSEDERNQHGLQRGRDVVECVTSLRHVDESVWNLGEKAFERHYVDEGRKCWLIRPNKEPSAELSEYLEGVPEAARRTKTCLERPEWWRFPMPEVPDLLFAQGFRGRFPKVVRNSVGARAVGGVCGIYDATEAQVEELKARVGEMDLREYVVPYSSGFHKVEINQVNGLLATLARNEGCSNGGK